MVEYPHCIVPTEPVSYVSVLLSPIQAGEAPVIVLVIGIGLTIISTGSVNTVAQTPLDKEALK